MAFELNQTAVSGAGLLRAIAAGGWTSNADLAERAGRRPNHITRDLKVFEGAGLITLTPDIALTDEGRAQLDAIARAEGQTTGGDLLPDERLVVHAQLRPDPDNPRKDFESDDAQDKLDELRTSIVQDGLLQNLVCRTDPEGLADFIVTAGNRRWHAIQQAIFDADWPEDRPIRIKVREGDACASLLTAIVENKQRADMSAIEEAEAFDELVNVHGLKTIDIHHKTGLSQKVIQNRRKLLRLSDDDRDRMRLPEDHPDHLGYKAALRQLTVSKIDIPEDHPEMDAMLAGIVRDFGLPYVPEGAVMAARDALRFSATTDDARAKVISACQLTPAPNVDRLKLTPKMILRLVEVAHALDQRPSAFFSPDAFTHPCTDCTSDIYSDVAATSGTMGRLIEVLFDQEADQRGVRLSVAGHQVLVALGLHPAQQSNALFRARCAADINAEAQRPLREGGLYATRWLNTDRQPAPPVVREPGSPDVSPTPTEAPSLGKKLTDTEALILAEVVDKAEREPNDQHPDYTAALPSAMKSGVPHLIARGLLGTRQLGMTLLIRPLLHTSGLKEWLESIGFYADRAGVMFELAARVQGAENTADRQSCGVRYATSWLNLEGDPRNEVAPEAPEPAAYLMMTSEGSGKSEFPSGIPTAAVVHDDHEQPELIEATDEEKAERSRVEDERACTARAQAAAERLAVLATDWMGFARARGARDYLNPCFEGGGVISSEAMALELVSAIVDGRTGEAAALLATLNVRAGVMGAQQTLKAMSLFKIQNAVSAARLRDTVGAA